MQISECGKLNFGSSSVGCLELHDRISKCVGSRDKLTLNFYASSIKQTFSSTLENKRKCYIAAVSDYVSTLNGIIETGQDRTPEQETQLKRLIQHINNPRVALDPMIIKNIQREDHQAYWIWTICRMLNRYANKPQNRIEISRLKRFLDRHYKDYSSKLIRQIRKNRLFFPSSTEEYLYLNGMRFFCKRFNQAGSSAQLRPVAGNLKVFRKYLVLTIAEAPFKRDFALERTTTVCAYNDHNNAKLPYGRSIEQISIDTKLGRTTVINILKNHPKQVKRVEYEEISSASKLVQRNNELKDVPHWIRSAEKGAWYVLYIPRAKFYHSTALGFSYFKLTKSDVIATFQPAPFKNALEIRPSDRTAIHRALLAPTIETGGQTDKEYHLSNIRRYVMAKEGGRYISDHLKIAMKRSSDYFRSRKAVLKTEDRNQLQLLVKLGQLSIRKMPYRVDKYKKYYTLKTSDGKRRMNLNDLLIYAHKQPIPYI